MRLHSYWQWWPRSLLLRMRRGWYITLHLPSKHRTPVSFDDLMELPSNVSFTAIAPETFSFGWIWDELNWLGSCVCLVLE